MAALTRPARVASASLLRLQTDARLAALARDGHDAAFDALASRHRAELVRAARRLVGDSRAEDAVQQALLNAHAALHATSVVNNPRAWLHTITHNSALNMLRSVRGEVPLDDASEVASSTAPPEDVAVLRERLRETLAAIDALPENQRAALLLRELEGRSHDDIARALDISPGAARQAVMRGRHRVRQAVSALIPYPLLAKLLAGSSSGATMGLAELIGGAGAGATALKLSATVAATGALAGGVVSADLAVDDAPSSASQPAVTRLQTTPTRPSAAVTPVGAADDRRRADAEGRSRGDDRSGRGRRGKSRHGRREGDDAGSGRRGRGGDSDGRRSGRRGGEGAREDRSGSSGSSGGSGSSGSSGRSGSSGGSGSSGSPATTPTTASDDSTSGRGGDDPADSDD